ncbi:Nn.00g020020.m01.CDS01 [Neocucurbitaria sp. VM-36]
MPFELHEITPADTLSWVRIRSLAYRGPTHDLLHSGPIRESSIHSVAEERKRDLEKPNTWHWKIVDTDLQPSDDDPEDNGGRTIAIAVWSMHNVKQEGINESSAIPAEKSDDAPGFLPPELRLDALASLLEPIRAAQKEIMGTEEQYFMLNSFMTHPDQQGRGAARLLLDWGLKKADKEDLVIYLDATETGRPIYEKRGFKLMRATEWDRVPWGGQGMDWHGQMVRQPHGN